MAVSLLRSHRNLALTLPPNPVCELHLLGYRHAQLAFYAQFAQRMLKQMGMEVKGPMECERALRRWTVLRSPFKYKRAQETFERRQFQYMFYLYNVSQTTLDGCLLYLTQMAPAGMDLKWFRFEHEDPHVKPKLFPATRPTKEWSEKAFYQEIAKDIHAKRLRGEL